MTFRKLTRTVTAASRPALEELVAYWESRQWRRTGPAGVDPAGPRRSSLWSQDMELAETSGDTVDYGRGGRRTVIWFD